MPVPTMKQNSSRTLGVTRLSHASTVSAVAPVSEISSDTSATTRRSCMSAMAPAGIEISMIGSISAVCTSATLLADDVICVIAQAAPTPWIRSPRLDNRLASQMRRNTECRSGAVILSERVSAVRSYPVPVGLLWLAMIPAALTGCLRKPCPVQSLGRYEGA